MVTLAPVAAKFPVIVKSFAPKVKAPVTLALPLKFCPQMVRVVVRVPALPVVFWLRVGKSEAMAILSSPVVVVFLTIPVARAPV